MLDHLRAERAGAARDRHRPAAQIERSELAGATPRKSRARRTPLLNLPEAFAQPLGYAQ